MCFGTPTLTRAPFEKNIAQSSTLSVEVSKIFIAMTFMNLQMNEIFEIFREGVFYHKNADNFFYLSKSWENIHIRIILYMVKLYNFV